MAGGIYNGFFYITVVVWAVVVGGSVCGDGWGIWIWCAMSMRVLWLDGQCSGKGRRVKRGEIGWWWRWVVEIMVVVDRCWRCLLISWLWISIESRGGANIICTWWGNRWRVCPGIGIYQIFDGWYCVCGIGMWFAVGELEMMIIVIVCDEGCVGGSGDRCRDGNEVTSRDNYLTKLKMRWCWEGSVEKGKELALALGWWRLQARLNTLISSKLLGKDSLGCSGGGWLWCPTTELSPFLRCWSFMINQPNLQISRNNGPLPLPRHSIANHTLPHNWKLSRLNRIFKFFFGNG